MVTIIKFQNKSVYLLKEGIFKTNLVSTFPNSELILILSTSSLEIKGCPPLFKGIISESYSLFFSEIDNCVFVEN